MVLIAFQEVLPALFSFCLFYAMSFWELLTLWRIFYLQKKQPRIIFLLQKTKKGVKVALSYKKTLSSSG